MALLENWPWGLALLDHDGNLICTNRAANVILQRADALSKRRRRIWALDPAVDHTLQRAIRSLLTSAPNHDARPDNCVRTLSVAVPRPAATHPYLISLAPSPHTTSSRRGDEPAILILLADPEIVPMPSADALSEFFGLTRAQARFAQTFVYCGNVKEVGKLLYITEHTARSTLKAIFKKTGTHSQATLIRLLISLPHASPSEKFPRIPLL